MKDVNNFVLVAFYVKCEFMASQSCVYKERQRAVRVVQITGVEINVLGTWIGLSVVLNSRNLQRC
jgi:hypothetical protein